VFENVIVGVDGGQGGRDAIALATQLVDLGGRLILAHAYGEELRPPGRSAAAAGEAKREHSLALLDRARAQAGIKAELRAVRAREPGQGLHVLAETEGADLLVVGSSRQGILGRVLLADDTHEALNGAPCAVAIALAGYALHREKIRKIGVGYNDSPESDNAIAVARRLADRYGADLSAFEAVSLPTYTFVVGAVPLEGEQLEEMVDAARARIAALGGVEAHAAYGITCEELVLYSGSVDLLILGSRDYGPIGRLVHGSTSQELARSARCPLLVLTRSAGAAPEGPSRSSSGSQHSQAHAVPAPPGGAA
jgi:nucleotide-binding universal stress UspA family protein